MKIEYDCECFERTLVIVFPDGYEHLRNEIEQMLDDYYCEWINVEEIEDPEEQQYVQCSCLEEHMVERLSKTYNMWTKWTSEYYGNDPKEMKRMCI